MSITTLTDKTGETDKTLSVFLPKTKVWVMRNNRPQEMMVMGVDVRDSMFAADGKFILYHLIAVDSEHYHQTFWSSHGEEDVFATKEDLIKSL